MASRTKAPRWIWQLPGWPRLSWSDAALAAPLARARRGQGELAGVARMLDREANFAAQLEVLLLEGLETSAIEGEKLDPAAVRSSLARRLGLPTAGLPPASRSIEGLVDVLLDATQRYDQSLTLKRLQSWQAALFPTGRSGLHEIRTGKLRGKSPMRIVSGPIGHERVHYEAPPHDRVGAEVRHFLAWFNEPPPSLDGLLRAGLAHVWFEIIHPFEDGNGRVGRALLDMALAQDEQRAVRLYSMSSRFMEKRDEYYGALEETSAGDLDVTPWLQWFLEQVAAATQSSESIIRAVLQKTRFWMRHARTPLNERQLKTLNRMFESGPGGFEGGMTNRKYAHLTKSSPATAQRDLADLVAKKCLVAIGAGRAAHYALALAD
jgi:Fic family protein